MENRVLTYAKPAVLLLIVCLVSLFLIQKQSLAKSFDQPTSENLEKDQQLAPLFTAVDSQQEQTTPNEYIIVLKNEAEITERTASQNSTLVDAVINASVTANGGIPLRTFTHALTGFSANLNGPALAAVRADKRVAFVEVNQSYTTYEVQLNPIWGLDRIDQADLPLDQTYRFEFDGSGIDAYVIDTGIRASHNEFGGRVLGGFNAMLDEDPADWHDCNGHGTHVAGILGGDTWGVAQNVNLYSVKALGCDGTGSTAGVIAAVDWVTSVADGPSLANMSLGGPTSAALDQAVQQAINSGITFVVASGNSKTDACSNSPARIDQTITVNASDINDQQAPFSNFGPCTDMFAPGHEITSAWHTSDQAALKISGTSMAAPHVSGVVARYLQGNPAASPAQIKSKLEAFAFTNKLDRISPDTPNLLLNANVKEMIDRTSSQIGDANCDGEVTSVDAMAILQFEVGQRTDYDSCPLNDSKTQIYAKNGNVNGDLQTTALDAFTILQCEVGQHNSFCPEKAP